MKRDWLLPALLACTAATLFHHIHNAEFLADYPNMPAWLSAPKVYAAWATATAVGFAGLFALRAGRRAIGLGLMALYGVYALDGLAHYLLAPLAAHTAAMNVSIALEAVTGVVLLVLLALSSARPSP